MKHRSGRPPEHVLGARGERAAEAYLLRKGFRLVARGFRCRTGEIDLVMLDRNALVFVEVKTRRRTCRASPAEAVDRRKRERLVRAASFYLAGLRGPPPPCRFDVVEVTADANGDLRARHIRDAFRLGSGSL